MRPFLWVDADWRLFGTAKLLLQHVDLAEAADVPYFMCKLCAEKRVDTLPGEFDADDSGSQDYHVHVVVLNALVG